MSGAHLSDAFDTCTLSIEDDCCGCCKLPSLQRCCQNPVRLESQTWDVLKHTKHQTFLRSKKAQTTWMWSRKVKTSARYQDVWSPKWFTLFPLTYLATYVTSCSISPCHWPPQGLQSHLRNDKKTTSLRLTSTSIGELSESLTIVASFLHIGRKNYLNTTSDFQ